jgi:hypothetical protein
MVTGVAAAGSASALPERWQVAGLYLGVGLAFATVGGLLLNLATAGRPTWRGMATVVGIVLGVLPVLLVAWPDLHNQPHTASLPVHFPRVVTAPPPTRPIPHARSDPAAGPSAAQQLEPVLAEVSDILNHKARPALSRAVNTLMRSRVHSLDPEAVRSQLTSATGDLEEVQRSLRQIQSRHDEFRSELTGVIGDSAVLDGVISRLRGLRDAIDGAPENDTLRRPGNEPRSVTAPLDQWITDCNQRIADLRQTLATAA